MAKFVPRLHFGGIFAQNVRHCSKKDAPIEPPIEPLKMSYNSYENQSSDPNTPPVIIMHGLFNFHSHSLSGHSIIINPLIHFQVYSVQSKIGGALAKPFIRKPIQREK